MAAGFGCLVLGVLGLLLPVLQASVRFYNWLLNHRLFGPSVREWRNHRSLPYRVKVSAIFLMVLSLGVSIVFFVPGGWPQAATGVLGVLLAVWLYRIPSRDRF